jgi:hypothetical protein
MAAYICLIADIVKSKEILNRGEVQKLLKATLADISRKSGSSIVSPYVVTTGDEFQAVYRSYDSIFVDIFEILWALYPYKIRFAISHGELVTEINEREAIGMDGPAFHKAREQIELMKRKEKYQRENPEISMIMMYGSSEKDLYLVNKSLRMFFLEYKTWTKTAVTSFLWLLKGDDIGSIASAAEVSGRMVYKSIKTNNINEYVDFFKNLPILLGGKGL